MGTSKGQAPAPVEDHLLSRHVYDKELEEAFVGTLLYKPAAAKDVVGLVRPEYFQHGPCRHIIEIISWLVEQRKQPDVHTVKAEVEQSEGPATVFDVARMFAPLQTGMGLEAMAKRLKEMATRRMLGYVLQDGVRRLMEDPDLDGVLTDLYAALDGADRTDRDPALDHFDTVMAEVIEHYNRDAQDLLDTGFVGLDRMMTGGVAKPCLVVLGARTSQGKTALAGTLAIHWARQGKKVSFLSMEMDRLHIGQRYLGVMAQVPVARLNARRLHDSEYERMVVALNESLPICTDDSVRSMASVRARASQHKRVMGGLDVLIVDYVQLMDVRTRQGEKRYEALGRISKGLKELAKDMHIVVVALAQLNREVEERKNEPPRVSDLRESGNLEQDADQVWLLWRPPVKGPLGIPPVRLIVAKNRQGPTCQVDLTFHAEAMTFLELDEEA